MATRTYRGQDLVLNIGNGAVSEIFFPIVSARLVAMCINNVLTKTQWQGQKPAAESRDGSFAEFISPLHGLRALMVLLLTYHLKHALDDISSIMNRFAPPHENDTGSYAWHVAKFMGVDKAEKLNLCDQKTLTGLARAIVLHENGKPPAIFPREWYDLEMYARAANLALSKKG